MQARKAHRTEQEATQAAAHSAATAATSASKAEDVSGILTVDRSHPIHDAAEVAALRELGMPGPWNAGAVPAARWLAPYPGVCAPLLLPLSVTKADAPESLQHASVSGPQRAQAVETMVQEAKSRVRARVADRCPAAIDVGLKVWLRERLQDVEHLIALSQAADRDASSPVGPPAAVAAAAAEGMPVVRARELHEAWNSRSAAIRCLCRCLSNGKSSALETRAMQTSSRLAVLLKLRDIVVAALASWDSDTDRAAQP